MDNANPWSTWTDRNADPKLLEEAMLVRELMESGYSPRAVARKLGRSLRWVHQRWFLARQSIVR